ncbi:RrF2 family transcriptional regulator [Sphingosinithalassobacter portus]|uniref:RrF2 family transcriptional regulator n=1 Tax=Stakelama portus TaxID=2676234 RepID=UPI000D6DC8A1|nr:Rrf2 family transcriptional regulator [Sphingosinithalassobacter portus]
MKRDGRLSGVLHVLLHMAEQDGPVTSEILAQAMQTNPVVIRRIMAGLREQGYVASERGHGGGWRLARPLDQVTLADIYAALGAPSLFAIGHRNADPQCLVEQSVNAALDGALGEAEAVLLASFANVTLAQLSADFHARMVAHPHAHRDIPHDRHDDRG